MTDTINLVIEAAINEKRIHLLTFAEANPNLEYYEFYKEHLVDHIIRKPIISSVDLSQITDVIFCERKEWIGIEERSSA